jgi:putative membrane protein
LLEFAGAIFVGDAGVNFLGAQGDVWDAQWDMLFCLVGSLLALSGFASVQDRQIAAIARAGAVMLCMDQQVTRP